MYLKIQDNVQIKVFTYFYIKVQSKGHSQIEVSTKLKIANDGTN